MSRADSHASLEATASFTADLARLGLTWLLIGAGLAGYVTWRYLLHALPARQFDLGPGDYALIGWSAVAVCLLTLSPWLVAGALLARLGRRGSGWLVLRLGAGLTAVWWLMDGYVHARHGQHLLELSRFALEPAAVQMGGGWGHWTLPITLWAASAALGVWLAGWLAGAVVHGLGARVRRLNRPGVRTPAVSLFACAVVLPLGLWDFWPSPGLAARTFLAMPIDLRLHYEPYQPRSFESPAMARLQRRLHGAYKRHFLAVTEPEPIDQSVPLDLDDPPNVLLIVLETLRPTVLENGLMPRLHSWAGEHAKVYTHHHTTNHSERAVFSLLYGRSPLVYPFVLDADIPPQMNATLRAAGYRCAYFSGQATRWERREEFVNPETFSMWRRNDEGDWPQWDRTALRGMTQTARRSEQPIFALTLLMASHFEYKYPPGFEKFTPVRQGLVWGRTDRGSLAAGERGPIFNRYRNSLLFLDTALTRALKRLDLKKNLVIITGDHGESFFEDGRLGHTHSFGRQVAETPMLIAGPGITPGVSERISSHADVLPTVLHALAGRGVPVKHVDGYDLLSDVRPPTTRLLAYVRRRSGEALLADTQGGPRLRLSFRTDKPALRLEGVENEVGVLQPDASIAPRRVEPVAAAFARHLERIEH